MPVPLPQHVGRLVDNVISRPELLALSHTNSVVSHKQKHAATPLFSPRVLWHPKSVLPLESLQSKTRSL